MSKTRACESGAKSDPQAESEANKTAVETAVEAEWAIWHKNQANHLVKEAAARKEAADMLAARKLCQANCRTYRLERAIREKGKLESRRALRLKEAADSDDKRIALSDVVSA